MANLSIYSADWGIQPVLFHVGSFDVQAYPFFVCLGLIVGAAVYFYEARRKGTMNENGFMIAVGSLLGAAIGAKVFEWLINYQFIIEHLSQPELLLSGRTITGGLIGGTIGAILAKKMLGIKEKRGNLFAPAVAIGVAIGRLGCFFRGCCYGKPTDLPWGVNFGDGVLRHPTQIYESLFMFVMFIYLERIKDRPYIKPGALFKRLMISYFVFRFFIEFIRVEPILVYGLTVFQVISIAVILYLTRQDIKRLFDKLKIYVRNKKA